MLRMGCLLIGCSCRSARVWHGSLPESASQRKIASPVSRACMCGRLAGPGFRPPAAACTRGYSCVARFAGWIVRLRHRAHCSLILCDQLTKLRFRDTVMKVREVIRMIERDGWVQIHQVGSHRQYKHPTKRGRVTVPGHLHDDLNPKTLKSVFRQAGLEEQV